MPRLRRVVLPGVPHHVTQRGNRRQRTFFNDGDYHRYLASLVQVTRRWSVKVWTYCLMPNHVHLILVPSTADGLTKAISELHRSYTWSVNRRQGWTGCLWQGRYLSFPMDEHHLLRAARYVLLNPVRAGLAGSATDWEYSSARCHVENSSNGIVDIEPLAERVADWAELLAEQIAPEELETLRCHQRTGRPLVRLQT